MALPHGTRIGHYEITSLLGKGGMGEVYRARDSKLHRDVALKVLPPVFAGDRERLSRFEREARVLASLNHAGIAQIYGIEERALVMELVEGETLAERIKRGPMPLEDVLPIATAGATSDTNESSGRSSGHAIPITPIGSCIAIVTLRIGGLWTTPSNLSAHAA